MTTLKSTREKCYSARDAFFKCMDKHGAVSSRMPTRDQLLLSDANPFRRQLPKDFIEKAQKEQQQNVNAATTPVPDECQKLKDEFFVGCLPSWIKHFELLREKDAIMDIYNKEAAGATKS